MKRSQPLLGALALSCAGFMAEDARAQPVEAELTRFEFRSPPGCGSAAEFVARVQRRSSRIRLSAEATAGRALVVELQPPDAKRIVSGSISVIEPDGATRARRLKAKGCDEAMEALSLIATVTLDPEALLAEPPAAEPEPPAKPKPAVKTPPPKAAPPPRRPAAPPETRPPFRVSFGAQATALFQVAPEPAFGGALLAAFEMRPGRVVSPLWRLSVVHAQRRGISRAAGDANFAFTLPTLDVCPLRLGPARWALRPCGYVGLGTLKVWGSSTQQGETHVRPSGSAGATLLVALRLSEALEIIADGRGGASLTRDSFAFDRVGFYRTSSLVFSAGIGLAGGFP